MRKPKTRPLVKRAGLREAARLAERADNLVGRGRGGRRFGIGRFLVVSVLELLSDGLGFLLSECRALRLRHLVVP